MTAAEYLGEVKYLRYRILSMENMINAVDDELYSISGVDPSREKVSCHSQSDISDKIIRAQQKKEHYEKQLDDLNRAMDEAERRIRAVTPPSYSLILTEIFLNHHKRSKIIKNLGIAKATFARWKRGAIETFEQQNHDFLEKKTIENVFTSDF